MRRYLTGLRSRLRRDERGERGSMLLVALGVLTLLSLLALAFATQMNIEKKASQNYVDGVKARLIAEGALARSIEEQRGAARRGLFSTFAEAYARGRYWLPLEVSSQIMDRPNDPYRPSVIGVLGQSYTGGADRYRVKVVDTQTQFNLNNTHNELVFKMMIRSLGRALAQEIPQINQAITQSAQAQGLTDFQDLLFPAGDPFERARYPLNGAVGAGAGGAGGQPAQPQYGADAIWALKQTKLNSRFVNKSELLEVFDENDYRVLRDFITTRSWLDPNSVDQLTTSSVENILGRGAIPGHVKNAGAEGTSASADVTARAPVNINLATRPLLYAALAPVAGRRVWLNTRVTRTTATAGSVANLQNLDEGSDYEEASAFSEEIYNERITADDQTNNVGYGSRRYMVYFPPIGFRNPSNVVTFTKLCDELVGRIIDRRENIGPFKSFLEWDHFIETTFAQLNRTNFPTLDPARTDIKPTIVRVLNKAVNNSFLQALPSGPLYNEIVNDPRFKEWYFRAYVGMLKANFNPNGRLSQMNPDSPVYIEIDKGNLRYLKGVFDVRVQAPGGTTTGPGPGGPGSTTGGAGGAAQGNTEEDEFQTLEWCFGSKGVFEIIALGEIVTDLQNSVLASYGFNAPATPDDPKRRVAVHAQDKVRAVLRIFDQVTHTTQRDFVTNGYGLGEKGKDPRNLAYGGLPRTDGKPGDAPRADIASYPVSERRWDPREPSRQGSQITAAEAAGNLDNSQAADASSGYLQLKPDYYSQGRIDEGLPLPREVNVGTGKTLFELRMDHHRRPQSLAGIYQDALGQPANRASLLVADVAGGRNAANAQVPGTNPATPPAGQQVYRNPPRNAFVLPLPPHTASIMQKTIAGGFGGGPLGQFWLTSEPAISTTKIDWLADFAYVDGYYAGEARRIYDVGGGLLQFPEYRAAYPDAFVPGSASADRPFHFTPPGFPFSNNKDFALFRNSAGYAQMKALEMRLRGTDLPLDPNRRSLDINRGALSFWYKPDFDWAYQDAGSAVQYDPTYCGFFSTTHVVEPQLPPNVNGKSSSEAGRIPRSFRGTQTYFMRTTQGHLRLTRLYFEVAGENGDGMDSTERFFAEGPYVLNPHLNDDPTLGATAAKEWLTVEEYKAAAENYFTQLSAATASFGQPAAPGGGAPVTFDQLRYYPWPPRELYLKSQNESNGGTPTEQAFSKIRMGRYDVWVDAADVPQLRQGDWYHFAVSWHDADPSDALTGNRRCQIFIDGQSIPSKLINRGLPTFKEGYHWGNNSDNSGRMDVPMIVPPTPPATTVTTQYPRDESVFFRSASPGDGEVVAFVRLNEIVNMARYGALKDKISIGGFNRGQKVDRSGVFKHLDADATLRPVSLPCNGTIDDFVIYETTDTPAAPALNVNRNLQRYPPEGIWTQRVDLQDLFGANDTAVTILGASFEAYLPYTVDRNGNVTYDQDAAVDMSVTSSPQSLPYGAGLFGTPAGRKQGWNAAVALDNSSEANQKRGAPNVIFNTPFNLKSDEMLTYQLRLVPGRRQRKVSANGGTYSMLNITSPVIDSVTIVYQLPKPEIFIKERVFD